LVSTHNGLGRGLPGLDNIGLPAPMPSFKYLRRDFSFSQANTHLQTLYTNTWQSNRTIPFRQSHTFEHRSPFVKVMEM